jgi:hypothetical protein
MSTLLEIEAATEALPPEQQEELCHFPTVRLRRAQLPARKARLVRAGDVLVEAPPGPPPRRRNM